MKIINNVKSGLTALPFFLLLLLGLASCGEQQGMSDDIVPERTIYERLAVHNRFGQYLAAIDKAGLKDALNGSTKVTAFVMSDSAFKAANIDVNALSAAQLKDILEYHMVPGAKRLGNIPNGYVNTVNGKRIWLKRALNPVTNFATGFDVNERRVRRLFAGFPQTNLYGSNGFFNEIDIVLMPPTQTVLQIIETNPDLSSLNAALTTAGLKPSLSGNGPITIFAPNNAAFTAANLGALTPAELMDRLKYHVADAKIPGVTPAVQDLLYTKDLTNNLQVPTMKTGSNLTVQVTGNTYKLNNNATLISANRNATNGVVHIIDKVL